MSNPIIPKRNIIATSQLGPLSGDLQLAELAVNTQTNKVYLKGNSSVFEIGSDKVASTQLTTAKVAGGVPVLDGNGYLSTAQIAALNTNQLACLTTGAVANLVPQLGTDGKISAAQLPPIVTGALVYKGTWVPNSNPVLVSGTGTKGDYYIATADATINPAVDGHVKILAGDMMAYNGVRWDLLHGATSEIISVNSQLPINGDVVLNAANVGAVATSQLTTLAVASGVPQLTEAGKLSTSQLIAATTSELGSIKVGSGLAIDGNGVVSVTGSAYTLPIATAFALGGIKASASIDVDGTTGVATVATAGVY
jgi:hypothetical protein